MFSFRLAAIAMGPPLLILETKPSARSSIMDDDLDVVENCNPVVDPPLNAPCNGRLAVGARLAGTRTSR